MRLLLDVNVLVALAWPNHVHHQVARNWFGDRAGDGWATCPPTESGFVRVSSNPVLPHAVTPAEAFELLHRLRGVGSHAFLSDDISLVGSEHADRSRIASHRLVTDAHVLAVARRHGGALATFDRGIRRSLSRGRRDETIVLVGDGSAPC
ncbi:MAG: TA system VapC family ribonuclease toxin [Acidimicrobiales bacterium]